MRVVSNPKNNPDELLKYVKIKFSDNQGTLSWKDWREKGRKGAGRACEYGRNSKITYFSLEQRNKMVEGFKKCEERMLNNM